jgi:hypothetical protein
MGRYQNQDGRDGVLLWAYITYYPIVAKNQRAFGCDLETKKHHGNRCDSNERRRSGT